MDGQAIIEDFLKRRWSTASFNSWEAWSDVARKIDAALAAARAEEREALRCCIEFTRLALERWYETECMMDGADVQEVLQESGVLVETTYDPAIHGEQDAEPGDPWMVFSPAWNAIRARTQP